MILQVLLYIVVAAALAYGGYKLGALLFRVDTGIEDFKRNLIRVSQVCSSLGMTRLAGFLEDIVVDDISGVLHKSSKIIQLLATSDTIVLQELDGVFSRILDAKLATEAGRAMVAARLAEAKVSATKES